MFADADGRAHGRVYEDAGDGFAHLAGEFRETRIEARTEAGEVLFDVEGRGRFVAPERRRVVYAHAP